MKIFSLISFYLGGMLLMFGGWSIYLSVVFYFNSKVLFIEWEIFNINTSNMIMTLLFDWMSLSFMGLVMTISSMVLIYSTFYMHGDKFFVRFILMVYLFVLSMVFLILSPNLISILLGWDGLGLVSYCLVIYYQNSKSANAGMITILSNRIGDVAILISIAWLLNYGSWNFFYLQFMYNNYITSVLMGLIIMAAMTKSAQMPFSAWLPAAMAAPTPVSALVHSSTLVTAGVYLLIRFNYMMGVNNFIFFVGVFTMFMSGLGANYEMDLKKIIALSTLSQLGLMMMTLGMGYVEFSFFHLMTHAMFKSLLFLCAGVFIHSMGDIQDIRMMGGLMISCPTTSFYFICSSMALCGVPFLSGFYSKDVILELYFSGGMNSLMFIFIFLATMFTLTYSVRLMYFVFFNNFGSKILLNLEESESMLIPMSLLLAMSLFAGAFMSSTLFPIYFIYLPKLIKLSVLLMVLGLFIVILYFLQIKTVKSLGFTHLGSFFLGSMWLLPYISSIFFMPLLKLGNYLIKMMDQGWLEYLGGQGAINTLGVTGINLDVFNYINVKFYLFMFMILALFFILI